MFELEVMGRKYFFKTPPKPNLPIIPPLTGFEIKS